LRRIQYKSALLATAATTIIGYVLMGGASLASAAERHRSGAVRQQLAEHIPAGRSSAVMTGADIMGAIVLLLAVIAILFLVTTFIRRRAVAPAVPVSSS
jgi:hypothetical protein